MLQQQWFNIDPDAKKSVIVSPIPKAAAKAKQVETDGRNFFLLPLMISKQKKVVLD